MAQYKLAKLSAVSSGISESDAGIVLVVQKEGIAAVPPSQAIVGVSTFKDGALHSPGTAQRVLLGTEARNLRVGEKVHVADITISVKKDKVTMLLEECDVCNRDDQRYKAYVAFQFPTGFLASADVGEIEDVISQVLTIDTGNAQTEQAAAPPAAGQPSESPSLINDDVIKMVHAQLPDSVIIAKIESSSCAFDTSLDEFTRLKHAGVSQAVLVAMAGASASQTATSGTSRATLPGARPRANDHPHAAQGFPQLERCGAAKDFVNQALEQIKSGKISEVEDGLQLLKHASELCTSLGDAWYYRSLFAKKLGRDKDAAYALEKAKLFTSEAMTEQRNPFILAAPAPPGGDASELPPLHEKWALAIGISRFHDPGLNLDFTSKDARDFSAVLQDPKYGRFKPANVHTITAEVTTRKLKEELNWLARSAQENDLVVIFLASHGTARSADTADVNYIVTSDTDLESQDSLFATALAMVDLSDIVRSRIKARRTVILFDTCHSGAAMLVAKERALGVAESSPSGSTLERIGAGIGRAILTSSTESQVSHEGPPFQNGYFTYFLLGALKQNDGMNSMAQIYAYVSDGVSKAVATKSAPDRGVNIAVAKPESSRGQTPVLSSSEIGAKIILGAPPASGGSSPAD